MQKLLKNNKGFTLVEVIVVAVIVLVLAAVAIPLYNGYIRDSRQASVENAAGAIASGCGAAVQTDGDCEIEDEATETDAGKIKLTTASGSASEIIIPKGMDVSIGGGVVTVTDMKNSEIKAEVTYSLQ